MPERLALYLAAGAMGLLLAACNPVVNFFAFHPDSSTAVPPDRLPPETEEVFFQASDGVRLQALALRHPDARRLTIYFHGNAGNVYHRLGDLQRLRQLGTNVLALSYRGYGRSEGSPDEAGLYRDAVAAYAHAAGAMGFAPGQIILFGRSLGSTTATDLAQDKNLAGVILISPLSSAADQAEAMGLGFASTLAGDAFDNVAKIARLKAPLLVLHGTNDRVVPLSMGRKLYAAAPGEKRLEIIEGAGHNNLSSTYAQSYWAAVAAFLRRTGP